MKHPHRLAVMYVAALTAVMLGGPARGQEAVPSPATGAPKAGATAATAPAKAAGARGTAAPRIPAAKSPYRKLAPGVLKEVDRDPKEGDTFMVHDIVELLAADSDFDWAKEVTFRHDVWSLEFKFKPVRMMWVDVPQAGGTMQRKLIWYMVYSVTNLGKTMHPVQQPDGTYKVEFVDEPIRFDPVFSLEVHRRLDDSAPEDLSFKKVYVDRLIPVALGPIAMREDRNRRFLNTTEMASGRIPVGKTIWGIVTWQDVDPRTKWFSIYVEGLTNAYRWTDVPGEFTRDDFGKAAQIGKGRRVQRKILKLNFWRPGDNSHENEKQIRYGVPGRVDYEWVYR